MFRAQLSKVERKKATPFGKGLKPVAMSSNSSSLFTFPNPITVSSESNNSVANSPTLHNNEQSIPAVTSCNLNFSTSTTSSTVTRFNFGSKACSTPSGDFKFGPTNILDKLKPDFTHSNSGSSQLDDIILECSCCDICFQDFSEVKCIPKVLECGHSICSVCLITLLDSKKMCPKCKEPLLKTSVNDYPTNFDLLSLSDSIRKYSCADPHVMCSLESLKKLLIIRRESLIKSIGDRTSLKNIMTNDITRIEQMIELDKDVLVPSEAKCLIKGIRENLEKVEKVLNCCCKPIVKQTYSITQYRNTVHFLYDLSIRLYKQELIYACEMVDGQLKYGKIEFDDDDILTVHALTSFTVKKNASVVSLRDLKKCLTLDNFLVFIKLGKYTLFFKLVDSSVQALQFIKLCTGEVGPVLQGSRMALTNKVVDKIDDSPGSAFASKTSTSTSPAPVQNWFGGAHSLPIGNAGNISSKEIIKVVTIENYMINSIKAEGCIDYDISRYGSKITCIAKMDDVVLRSFPEGKYNIFKRSEGICENIIGILHNKNQLLCETFNATFVEDCGIAFRL